MRTRLVERAREGDDGAFTELVDLDGNLCHAIAHRILRDPERAQDAVQQAFLLAWRELPRLPVYMFTLFIWNEGVSNGRELFDALAATIDLRPEDAVLPSPSLPGRTT